MAYCASCELFACCTTPCAAVRKILPSTPPFLERPFPPKALENIAWLAANREDQVPPSPLPVVGQ